MIKFENVDFSYEKGNNILNNINIHIKKGKKVAFLGENGSGKSTLFLLMNGILKAHRGEIYINGEKLLNKKEALKNIRKQIGIVFQDPETQIIAPTIMQEMAYGLQNMGVEKNKVEEIVNKALEEVGLLAQKDKLCHTLSYGQKKRLCIASIFAMNPEIIILDEPLVWLDPENYNKVIELLEEKTNQGKTIIFSTHDVNFAYNFADYIYILKDGHIVKEGNKHEIFQYEKELKEFKLDFPEVLKIANIINKHYGIEKEDFLNKYNENTKN